MSINVLTINHSGTQFIVFVFFITIISDQRSQPIWFQFSSLKSKSAKNLYLVFVQLQRIISVIILTGNRFLSNYAVDCSYWKSTVWIISWLSLPFPDTSCSFFKYCCKTVVLAKKTILIILIVNQWSEIIIYFIHYSPWISMCEGVSTSELTLVINKTILVYGHWMLCFIGLKFLSCSCDVLVITSL